MRNVGTIAIAALLLIGLAGCGASSLLSHEPEPPPPVSEATPPPAPPPPPLDVAGRWRLSAAGGASCYMTLTANPGAAQGKIAPEGGCPGSFFTSRKWTFENGALIIRDFKDRPLAQLSYSADHFQGQDPSGAAITLVR